MNLKDQTNTIDKLGIKIGFRLLLVGGGGWLSKAVATRFDAQVDVMSTKLSEIPQTGSYDIIVIWAKNKSDLGKAFRTSKRLMKENGSVWAVVRKRTRKEIRPFSEIDVFSFGKDVGLVDVKVAGLSEYEYALKFVIPLKRRGST